MIAFKTAFLNNLEALGSAEESIDRIELYYEKADFSMLKSNSS